MLFTRGENHALVDGRVERAVAEIENVGGFVEYDESRWDPPAMSVAFQRLLPSVVASTNHNLDYQTSAIMVMRHLAPLLS